MLEERGEIMEERRVHPDCINASNPYHECVDYCFRKIAEAKVRMVEDERGNSCSFIPFDCLFAGYSFSNEV